MLSSGCTLLGTSQAARLVNRKESSLREAIASGALYARPDDDGHWLMTPEDVIAWDKRAARRPRCSAVRAWDRAATLLGEYGSLSAEELAELLGIHVGNARKHLAILAKQGRAQRRPDGQWVLTSAESRGAA